MSGATKTEGMVAIEGLVGGRSWAAEGGLPASPGYDRTASNVPDSNHTRCKCTSISILLRVVYSGGIAFSSICFGVLEFKEMY